MRGSLVLFSGRRPPAAYLPYRQEGPFWGSHHGAFWGAQWGSGSQIAAQPPPPRRRASRLPIFPGTHLSLFSQDPIGCISTGHLKKRKIHSNQSRWF